MSDHLDSPDATPGMDPRLDICDIYAFQKPGDRGRTVLVLDVNPFAPTGSDEFHPEAIYELLIDTDGDAAADMAYRFTFSPKEEGRQLATLRVARGDKARNIHGRSEALFKDVPVSFGTDAIVRERRGHRFFAGIRSDPFFFDLAGYLNAMHFTGTDLYRDKNLFSMVLELPNEAIGVEKVGIWARVLVPTDGDAFAQVDRMGKPFVNVAFIEDKETFNRSEPSQDRELFTEEVVELLVKNGRDRESALQMVLELLPDVLEYDPSQPTSYPNGRTLTDDVIDHQLSLVTNGKITSDMTGPHDDLLDEFPYLGPPHPLMRTIQALAEASQRRSG